VFSVVGIIHRVSFDTELGTTWVDATGANSWLPLPLVDHHNILRLPGLLASRAGVKIECRVIPGRPAWVSSMFKRGDYRPRCKCDGVHDTLALTPRARVADSCQCLDQRHAVSITELLFAFESSRLRIDVWHIMPAGSLPGSSRLPYCQPSCPQYVAGYIATLPAKT